MASDPNAVCGQRLLEIRTEQDFTLVTIERLTGIAVRRLRRIETGQQLMTRIELTALARLFGRGMAEFFGKPRPKRRAIPVKIKRLVVARQEFVCAGRKCPAPVHWSPRTRTAFDHSPALRLRDLTPDGTEYSPHQHEPSHIDALCPECHDLKTRGAGATTAGTDIGKIKKERKRGKSPKPKRKWPQRASAWPKGRGFHV